ncbi:UTP11-like, U3 small nucleolar ribonucleoprotein [Gaertneriomyces sp. JEL0708]|nr:UTP11-like, U3 small nucleolar ribonucleoprotein [Gaertneriomyces sp. JEL0708]
MSSLRNAVQRRNHKERGQLQSRSHKGILEKHKDYVLRAKDYHKKQDYLKTLRQKATARNPDEFYFGMINSKTKKGVHVITKERSEKFDAEVLKLLKTQDQGYVRYLGGVNRAKIDKLKKGLHLLEEEDDEDEADEMDTELGDGAAGNSTSSRIRHTVFVDDEDEVKSFDPSQHFDTPGELLSRTYNRPTKSMLESDTTAAVLPDFKTQQKLLKKREQSYRELASRLDRDEQLRKTQQEMDLQKNLMGKGPRKKVGEDSRGLPIYKWKAQRKR